MEGPPSSPISPRGGVISFFFSFFLSSLSKCMAVNYILTKQMVLSTIQLAFTFAAISFSIFCVFSLNMVSPLLSASCPWLSVAC